MRILGMDHGGARLGLAMSDESGIIATPLAVVDARGDLKRSLGDIIHEKNVRIVVIGYPLDMNGNPGDAARKVEKFAEKISRWFGVEVKLWDERYTTSQASGAARKSGDSTRKGRNDMAAATIILQSWLDCVKNRE